MNPVKIITDSTCDLPLDLLAKNDVEMVPLNVTIGGSTYRDCLDITTPKLFELVSERKELPKTSAVAPEVLMKVFKKYVDLGYDVVFMGIGSKLSSTYSSAMIVSQEFENRVFVLDSMNLSSAIGLQVLKMIDFRNAGLSAAEIAEKMKEITPKTQCSFAIKTMDYLYKGGRCSGIKYFFGKILKICPIIKMKDCVLNVHKTPRGRFENALDIMIKEFKEAYDAGKVDLGTVTITHACSDEYCEYIVQKLSEFMDPKYLLPTYAGCVISSHCGPKCIGILYIEK
ncbi:MAG: DegV family protein [Erysipelotrichales bacterium]|nr:DegV family protein [Erysipelotrichales bacterium]